MRLNLTQWYLPHTQILCRGIPIWVIAHISRGGENGICGGDGDEFRVSSPECKSPGTASTTEYGRIENGANEAHYEVVDV